MKKTDYKLQADNGAEFIIEVERKGEDNSQGKRMVKYYSEAQKRASMKYNNKAYDEIKIRVPKGDKEAYKKIAEEKEVSLNRLIVDFLESMKGENNE